MCVPAPVHLYLSFSAAAFRFLILCFALACLVPHGWFCVACLTENGNGLVLNRVALWSAFRRNDVKSVVHLQKMPNIRFGNPPQGPFPFFSFFLALYPLERLLRPSPPPPPETDCLRLVEGAATPAKFIESTQSIQAVSAAAAAAATVKARGE